MKITVTAEHIKNGVQHWPTMCPVSLAFREKFDYASVGAKRAHVDSKTYYRLPRVAQKFIADFDCRRKVAPFEFEARRYYPYEN
jgi:hypothetical protein